MFNILTTFHATCRSLLTLNSCIQWVGSIDNKKKIITRVCNCNVRGAQLCYYKYYFFIFSHFIRTTYRVVSVFFFPPILPFNTAPCENRFIVTVSVRRWCTKNQPVPSWRSRRLSSARDFTADASIRTTLTTGRKRGNRYASTQSSHYSCRRTLTVK